MQMMFGGQRLRLKRSARTLAVYSGIISLAAVATPFAIDAIRAIIGDCERRSKADAGLRRSRSVPRNFAGACFNKPDHDE